MEGSGGGRGLPPLLEVMAGGNRPVEHARRARRPEVRESVVLLRLEDACDHGVGISRSHELIDLGCDRGLIEKSGAWFTVAGERLGPGRDKAAEALRQNPGLGSGLEQSLREHAAAAQAPVPTQPEAAA